jgi:hypothetical protein
MCLPDRLTDINNKIKLIDAVLQIFLFCANGTNFFYIILFKRKKKEIEQKQGIPEIYIKNAKLYIFSLSNCQDEKINQSEIKSQVSTPAIQSTLGMLHTKE